MYALTATGKKSERVAGQADLRKGGLMDAGWSWLLDILVLLAAAMVLGALAERFRQSAILGYLAAGLLVGPNLLGLVGVGRDVDLIIELGVTLLLFSIGLEFSLRRLIRLGPVTYLGGTLQVALTALAAFAAAWGLGLSWQPAAALGMIAALSSTASVVRVLTDSAKLDCIYGRNALGILLLQDIALVPLVLLMVTLSGQAGMLDSLARLGRSLALALGLAASFYLVFNRLIPWALNLKALTRNRELPILLAVVMSLGSALVAHQAGLSPSLGAFLAGMLLAESPFSAQIRSDIASLRTLLVTLFFAAVGMLVEPSWVLEHWLKVTLVLAAVAAIKPLIIWPIVRLFRTSHGMALATGLCLGQVGEFSFVLARMGLEGHIIDSELFRLVVSVTVLSLFLTPFLVRLAPHLAGWVEGLAAGRTRSAARPAGAGDAGGEGERAAAHEDHIVIVGLGPAGRQVAEYLLPSFGERLVVLENNPGHSDLAEGYGIEFQIGDARQREVLEHLGIERAAALVITIPDPDSCRQIIHLARTLAPELAIICRSRYHIHHWNLLLAGAQTVVDEEMQVGERLAVETLAALEHHPAAEDGAPPP